MSLLFHTPPRCDHIWVLNKSGTRTELEPGDVHHLSPLSPRWRDVLFDEWYCSRCRIFDTRDREPCNQPGYKPPPAPPRARSKCERCGAHSVENAFCLNCGVLFNYQLCSACDRPYPPRHLSQLGECIDCGRNRLPDGGRRPYIFDDEPDADQPSPPAVVC